MSQITKRVGASAGLESRIHHTLPSLPVLVVMGADCVGCEWKKRDGRPICYGGDSECRWAESSVPLAVGVISTESLRFSISVKPRMTWPPTGYAPTPPEETHAAFILIILVAIEGRRTKRWGHL